MRFPLPVGYCCDDQDRIVVDPDDEVRGAVALVFRLFQETGSAYGVVQRFAQDGLRFPTRAYGGAWAGKLIWGRLTHSRVLGLLKNPSYAGTYVFGRYQYATSITPEGEVRKNMRAVPMPDWRVHLPAHHEGYITMEEFEQNRQRLAHNRTNGEGTLLSGPAREGLALLQGLLMCGICGHALTVRYKGNGGIYPVYECNWKRREGLATKNCLTVHTDLLDDAVSEEVFKVLKPAELELALAAMDDIEQRDQAIMRQWQMRIERAGYDCALAERRYEEVDPSNRLVAASLESRWNAALLHVDEVKVQAATFQNRNARLVTAEQKTKVLALARDLPRVWRAPTTQSKDRKRMLRLLIADITVEKLVDTRQVVLHVRWQGGACSDIAVALPLPIAERLRYTPQVVERIRELSQQLSDPQIVETLNQQGLRSSHGLPFTLSMVKWIRYRYGVPLTSLMRPGELTVQQLAQRLGVGIGVVHYWIKHGTIEARQLDGRGPWWITVTGQQEVELRDYVRNSMRLKNHQPKTKL